MNKVVLGINRIHEGMLELVKKIDNICTRENIPYFLDGGSWIGAIRHNGFIPWDDDIDISIMKKDYLRLIEILRKENSFYLYFDDFSHHCSSFVYCYNDVWQCSFTSFFPILYPIKLDIRPINAVLNTETAICENYLFRNMAEYIIFGKCNLPKESIISKISEFGGNEKFLIYYNTTYGLVEGDDIVLSHPYLSYSVPNTFPVDYVNKLKKVRFEDTELNIPVRDALLVLIYGDYMKLPPESERVSYSKSIYRIKDNKINKLCKLYTKFHSRRLTLIEKIKLKLMMKLFSKKICEE